MHGDGIRTSDRISLVIITGVFPLKINPTDPDPACISWNVSDGTNQSYS